MINGAVGYYSSDRSSFQNEKAAKTFPSIELHQRTNKRLRALLLGLITICLFGVSGTSTFAQSAIPKNAQPKSYGTGWECKPSFRENNGGCSAIIAPQNAYLTGRPYGQGWECKRGFEEDENICEEIIIPENAYLDASGHQWRCDRGFLSDDNKSCTPIQLPENAHLTARGNDWECPKPFLKLKDTCGTVTVPQNAYQTYSSFGRGWDCRRGFLEANGKCEAIDVPEYAFLSGNTFDGGWKCTRGYQVNGSSCAKIIVPENAHLGRSGNNWDCNRSFRKEAETCVLN